MKHVYYFDKSVNSSGTIARIINWCHSQAGECKVDWEIWTKFADFKSPDPLLSVGIKINKDEVAFAFELAFNVKKITLGENRLLKSVYADENNI